MECDDSLIMDRKTGYAIRFCGKGGVRRSVAAFGVGTSDSAQSSFWTRRQVRWTERIRIRSWRRWGRGESTAHGGDSGASFEHDCGQWCHLRGPRWCDSGSGNTQGVVEELWVLWEYGLWVNGLCVIGICLSINSGVGFGGFPLPSRWWISVRLLVGWWVMIAWVD